MILVYFGGPGQNSASLEPILTIFGIVSLLEAQMQPGSQNLTKNKKEVFDKHCRTNVFPQRTRNGQMCDPYYKYYMF